MGSMAQDARHEQSMREARDAVFRLTREVEEKKKALSELESKLKEAEEHLVFMEGIDARRD